MAKMAAFHYPPPPAEGHEVGGRRQVGGAGAARGRRGGERGNVRRSGRVRVDRRTYFGGGT